MILMNYITGKKSLSIIFMLKKPLFIWTKKISSRIPNKFTPDEEGIYEKYKYTDLKIDITFSEQEFKSDYKDYNF